MSRRLQKKLEEAIARFGNRDFGGAERLCTEILAKAPRNPAALHLIGVLRLQTGNARDAVTLIGRALEAGPEDPDILENLGVAYLAAHDCEKAERTFRKVIALGAAHAAVYMRLGLALDGQGKRPEAEKALRTAADRNPGDPDAHLNLGNNLAGQGRLGEALQCFRGALALRPDYVDAHYNAGTVLERMGRIEEAVSAYRSALALAPDYADAHNNLGIAYERLGRIEDAIDSYRRVLVLDPNNVHALSNLGKALRARGRIGEAEGYCEKALAIAPDFIDALNNLAAVRVEQGRYDAALRSYEKALAIDSRNADAQLSHGMLCLGMGDFDRGWRGYQWRPTRLRALASQVALDDKLPEDVAGKTVMLLGEQGLGDELFFLRFAQELKKRGAHLVYACEPKLRGAIERSGLFDRLVAQGEPLPGCDLQFLAGDLPLVLLGDARAPRTPRAFSLSALDARLKSMRMRLAGIGPHPYIGLTWRAGTPLSEQTGRPDRALCKEVPLDVLAGALESVRGTVLALQRNPRSDELDDLRRRLGREVCDMSDANEDLEDMLALLTLIDEYVGVSNTNMHLMAGIGRAGRVMVPHPPEWRWMLEGEGSPWFPGFNVYRQPANRDWSTVQARLTEDLRGAPSQARRK
jgi:tetratricopeptide (TPR) repeat protein